MKKTINPFKGQKDLSFIIIFFLVMILLSTSPAEASVSGWSYSPQKLVSGDILNIAGTASPGDTFEASASFEKIVPVTGGKYEYALQCVQIPEGFDNFFKVEAAGVKNLNVRVKAQIWLTRSSAASGDTAIVSQSGVPAGNYTIVIDGDAGAGASQVHLNITASQGIKADSTGNFVYSYSTKSIPPGEFNVNIGGITQRITVLGKVPDSSDMSFLGIKFSDKVVYVLNHTADPLEGNWISLGSPDNGCRIQLPQPVSFSYSGPRFGKYGGISANLSAAGNGSYTLDYPSAPDYTTFPVYQPGDKVNISFFGDSSLKGNVSVYVLNVTSNSVYGVLKAFNAGNIGNLGSLFRENVGGNYTRYSAALEKGGDLLNYSLGSYAPGQYCIVLIQENEDKSLTILSGTTFIVAEHSLKVVGPTEIKKGDDLDLSMELESAPASGNYSYGALLVNAQAYRAKLELESNGTKNGTSLAINGVKVIDESGINASNYRSKLTKNEFQKEIQTLIGTGNGTLAIGEPGQKNLSLAAFDLPEGHYYLFAGAYDPKRRIAGLTQSEVEITGLQTGALPAAKFNSSVSRGYYPLSVRFTDLSENATAWNWDFGDGAKSTEQNPEHTYSAAGNYTVTLSVSNENGKSLNSATINVQAKATGPYAYITNYFDNTVSKIDTASDEAINTIPVGSNPFGVAVSPDGANVYVTNRGSNNVSVIDTALNTVVATVAVGSKPYGIAVSPEGSNVYVTNEYGGTVSVIDTATNAVSATLPVGSWPSGIAVSPDGAKVYVISEEGTVSVIDTATNTITATVGVGSNPIAVAVSPDGSKVYIANYADNTVSVIYTANNTVTATVEVGSYPGGIAVSPDGSKVYVANEFSNSVSVIDTASNKVVATIDAGNSLWGVAVSPDGSKVYVANENSDSVSVIDSRTNKIVATVKVGSGPIAFGKFIGPVQKPVPACNLSSIYGYCFNDSNSDRKKNNKEAGLSNMTISLNGFNTCKGKLVSKIVKTNSKGYYEFKGVGQGVYVVSQRFVFGWLPTTNAAYTLKVPENSTNISTDFGNKKFVK